MDHTVHNNPRRTPQASRNPFVGQGRKGALRLAPVLAGLTLVGALAGLGGYLRAQQAQNNNAAEAENAAAMSEEEFIGLFLAFAQAQESDPCAPETIALRQRWERALAAREDALATEPDADLSALPGAAMPEPTPPEPATTLPNDADLLELFTRLAAAQAADPDSAETQRLQEEFDRAVAAQETEAAVVPVPPDAEAVEAAPSVPEVRIDLPAPTTPSPNVPPPPSMVVTGTDIERPAFDEGQLISPEDLRAHQRVTDPDDVVQIRTEEGLLDMALLVEVLGREFGFTFLYDSAEPITGQFRLEQYGELRRRDLLPLLESLLSFSQLAMVRQGNFIRIVPRAQSLRRAAPPIIFGDEAPTLEVGDTIVAQIFPIRHVEVEQVRAFLNNFTDASTLVAIPNTHYVIFTEYAARMPRLLEMVRLIDQPGPPKRLEAVTVEYLEASDAAASLEQLIADLAAQGVSFLGGENRAAAGQPAAAAQPQASPTPQPPGADQPAAPERPRPAPQVEQTEAASAPRQQSDRPTGGNPRSNPNETGPLLRVDARTNRIFIIGTDQQIALVRQLLALIDVEEAVDPIVVEPIQVRHVLAADVSQQVSQLADVVTQRSEPGRETAAVTQQQQPPQPQPAPQAPDQARPTPRQGQAGRDTAGGFMLADERTNRIFVVGTRSQIELIKELLGLLDVPPFEYAQPVIRVYQPQYVEAAEALNILDQLRITRPAETRPRQAARDQQRTTQTPVTLEAPMRPPWAVEAGFPPMIPGGEEFEVTVAVQKSTNKLFVLATVPQHEDIAELMGHIDQEPDDTAGAIRIYNLENRDPADVAAMLRDLLEADRLGADDTAIPGVEGAPKIVALDDIYAVAVRGTPRQHTEIEDILKVLDRRLAQVLVEAILVQVTASDDIELGVQLQDSRSVGGSRRVSGISPFALAAGAPSAGQVVAGTGGVLAFFDDRLVYATLEALQKTGDTRVSSEPRILVNDHEAGSITSERQEPTTKTTIQPGSDTPIITFDRYVNAGTTLQITPHISEGDYIKLEISLMVNSFDGTGSANVPPPISRNEINTVVNVPDGMTVVLGGLKTRNDSINVNKIPLLGDIPWIGSLFQNVSRGESEATLYVFVRSQIVRSREEDGFGGFEDLDAASEPYRDRLRQSEAEYDQHTLLPGVPEPNRQRRSSVLED